MQHSKPASTNSLTTHPLSFGLLLALGAGLLILVVANPTAAVQPEPSSPAIVGGEEAVPGAWPFQVALIRADGDTWDDQYCGGSLVAPQWVLTAAHCVDDRLPEEVEVLAGIHNLAVPDPEFQRLAVVEIRLHPDYNDATEDSDIALLRLTTSATFRTGQGAVLPIAAVQPAAASAGSLTGIRATVIGWGSTKGQPFPGGYPTYPDTLQQVEVPIISNEACDTAYQGEITENMLCAKEPQGGKDSCQGDSGGPMLVQNIITKVWQQVGIVSWGSGCAAPAWPGVYTRVSQFADWIAAETGVAKGPCESGSSEQIAECAALVTFYDATNGSGWLNRSGWLTSASACDWYGVSCESGRISRLEVPSNGLEGRLPDALGQLTKLQHLDIADNATLAGPLPNALTALTMTTLRFDGTHLCEPTDVPMQSWLAGITNLASSGAKCGRVHVPATFSP